MCCLKYEQETYEEIRKRLPRYGSIVNTPLGRGEVINNNTIKEEIKVKIFGDGDDVIEYFPISECEMIKGSYEASSGKSNRKKDIEGDEQKNSNPKKEQLKNQDQEETGSDEQASQPENLD